MLVSQLESALGHLQTITLTMVSDLDSLHVYQVIKKHPSLVDQYTTKLISEKVVTEGEYKVHPPPEIDPV